MSRPHRELAPESCYHVTTRCNNREFHLTQPLCRNLLLYALSQAIKEFGFKLYALCLMSNHVHYLLEPAQPADLPRLMHWLNWYSARCFNRLLRRTGHFWERRYHSSGFARDDHVRALNTLRYIHGNPRAAGIQTSFFYRYSNYASYAHLSEDGLTQWHPAFLTLAETLDECSARYRNFCRQYRPESKPKPRDTSGWGSQRLPQLSRRRGSEPPDSPVLPGFGCQVTAPRFPPPPEMAAVVRAWEQAQAQPRSP